MLKIAQNSATKGDLSCHPNDGRAITSRRRQVLPTIVRTILHFYGHIISDSDYKVLGTTIDVNDVIVERY